jgi:hypothetical protein
MIRYGAFIHSLCILLGTAPPCEAWRFRGENAWTGEETFLSSSHSYGSPFGWQIHLYGSSCFSAGSYLTANPTHMIPYGATLPAFISLISFVSLGGILPGIRHWP